MYAIPYAQKTLEVFIDRGVVGNALEADVDVARSDHEELREATSPGGHSR